MNDDIDLRPFQWSDVPEITALYAHYVEQSVITFDTEVPSELKMAEKFGTMVEAGHPLIVAERGGAVIGYAYASQYRPRYAYRFTCENSIYVHKDATGRGLGRRLLGRLIEDSTRFGFKQMIAVITADTLNSIALHEKFGFQVIGRYPALGYKFDRWLDIVHMQRAL